jgi:DNA-binding transcriptional ArsR family regulator
MHLILTGEGQTAATWRFYLSVGISCCKLRSNETMQLLRLFGGAAQMTQKNGKSIDQQIFERQANMCKAFANPTRLRLLDILGNGEHAVADIQEKLGISKANLSQHLAVLKSTGVVTARRDGKHVLCSLAMPEIKQACQLIQNVLRIQAREMSKLSSASADRATSEPRALDSVG